VTLFILIMERSGKSATTPLAVDGTGRKASALQGLALGTELPGLLRTGVVA